MKTGERRAALALVAAAAIAVPPLVSELYDGEDDARENAESVERHLDHDILTNKPVEILPGIVAVRGAKLRDLPVVIHQAGMVDEVPSLRGNFVLTRPFVVENEDRLNDSDPKYWIAGFDPTQPTDRSRDIHPTEGLVFMGVSAQTLPLLEYYASKNADQQPATICARGISNTFVSPVIAEHNSATIIPDGYTKDVGLIEDLSDKQLDAVIDQNGYEQIPTDC